MGAESAGFWSYAREDDASAGGHIRAMAESVRNEYSLLTGEELRIFIDRDIEWGEAWKVRIDDALAATTFFIPIITPRYFSRPECRRELLTFAGHAKSLGREELLLPIYYVGVSGLEDGGLADEAMELVTTMQWADWRELRLEAPDSSAYRRAIASLAKRLADIDIASLERPPIDAPATAPPRDDEPGVLELVAEAEDAFPRFNQALEDIGSELDALTALGERWGPVVERAAAKGAGPTLHAMAQFADDVAPIAARIEDLGRVYSAQLVRIDPAVLALLRRWELGSWEESDAQGMVAGIREMHTAAVGGASALEDLERTLSEVSGLSRDIKRPLTMIRDGLKNVRDGQAVLDEWVRRADQIEEDRKDDL